MGNQHLQSAQKDICVHPTQRPHKSLDPGTPNVEALEKQAERRFWGLTET